MGAEYYLFALFVFGLVALLIVFFLKGMKKNRVREEEELGEKEKKVMMLYFETEDMIEALKEYVESSRESIDGNIKRVETDMQALATLRDGLDLLKQQYEEKRESPPALPAAPPEQPPAIVELSEAARARREKKERREMDLEKTGEDVDSIAERMNISKGEAALMLKLSAYGKGGGKDRESV
jgi:hypothetical protein